MTNRGVKFALALMALPALAQAEGRGWVSMTSQGVQPLALKKSLLIYRGGTILSKVKVYAVMWGQNVDAATQSGIGAMLAATVNSTYLDSLAEYNTPQQTIGRGTFGGMQVIQPSKLQSIVADTDIGPELERQIQSGTLPAPDENTAYMTYFPPGVTVTLESAQSCKTFCGYHHNYKSQTFGANYYGVVADLSGDCALGCGGNQNSLENVTTVSSHELAELITDPAVEPTAGAPAFPDGWNTNDGKEIGDLCNGTQTSLSTSSGQTYILQREFDNASRSCLEGPFTSP